MNTASSENPPINPDDQFDVAVIGHANVDIFFTLSEDDPDWRLNTKTKELSFAYGEKIAVKEAQYAMGGNGQNVAVGLSRLGYKVTLLEEIGGDAFAQDILKNLEENGVDASHLIRKAEKRTSIGVVMNVQGDRTILSQHVEHKHEVDLSQLAPRLIYLTSLGPVWEEVYQKVLEFAAQNGVPIAFNPGTSQLNQHNEIVSQAIKQSHILVVNLEEAKTILEKVHPKAKLSKLSVEELMAQVAELGPKIVVITDGKNGSYARAEDGRCFHQAILPAEVVERTGAGDSFTAGLLGAALSGKSLQKAMYWGAKNAASVVSQVGSEPGLLTREQIEAEVDPLLVNLGMEQSLYQIHFGHPDDLSQRLFKSPVAEITPEQIESLHDAYQVIYEAVREAITLGVPESNVLIEVNPIHGENVLEQARKDGLAAALAVKIDEDFASDLEQSTISQWIEKYQPQSVAAAVGFNPAEPVASRKAKKAALKLLSDRSHQSSRKFILDIDIIPEAKQLDRLKGDLAAFNKSTRTDLTVKSISEFHQAGIEPDAWRFEYTNDSDQYRQLLAEMRKGEHRTKVGALLSGENATDEQLIATFEAFASVNEVVGYTAGTHIFKDAIADYINQNASRLQAKNRIAQEFLHLYQSYRDAAKSVETPLTDTESTSNQAEKADEPVASPVTPTDMVMPAKDKEEVKEAEPTPAHGWTEAEEQETQNPFRPPVDASDAQPEDKEPTTKPGLFSRLFKR